MDVKTIFALTSVSLLGSYLSLITLRYAACYLGLVDKPDHRKRHYGHIPLVGGIAVYVGISLGIYFYSGTFKFEYSYLLYAGLFLILGLFDDLFDMPAFIRLIIISMVSIILIVSEGWTLYYFGDLLGIGDIYLNDLITPITIIAIIGGITAFNMIDGMDGLLGFMALVLFLALSVLFYVSGDVKNAAFCLMFIAALVPYLAWNLGHKHKVFMGDAGSLFIGFTVVWLLIHASKPITFGFCSTAVIKPVTALWLVAIPLMDMARVIIMRLFQGKSIFKPDRSHIHFLLLDCGFKSNHILFGLVLLSSICAVVGILMNVLDIPEIISFVLFVVMFFIYSIYIMHYVVLSRNDSDYLI
ncbi:UDP-N-acetylglucosamine--undecaprenyl-phosphate N-acetylglucosaminephosphotransferase [Vibrio rotiferianus]|uniref:UDP-N-acetylglucosamine--undecaprenyl-phosphate N-acetylglucosaminephosphotransferase n=1 Tax=Vibrio rotiferianus TaxID=190895 RepID=UPI00406AAA15